MHTVCSSCPEATFSAESFIVFRHTGTNLSILSDVSGDRAEGDFIKWYGPDSVSLLESESDV